jgi:DNA recombination protein RmuC
MEVTSIFIGIGIGAILGYLFFFLLSRGNKVARSEYDALHTKHNEASLNLKLTEERLKTQQETAASLQQKADAKTLELSTLLSHTATLEATLQHNSERIKELQAGLSEQTETNKTQQAEINAALQKIASFTSNNQALNEKLATQKEEMLSIQKTAHLQFEKLAQQIFEEKSGKFTESNKANMEALLKPLNENIDQFKRKVEETYDKESKQRFSLEKEVKNLIDTTNKISLEANNLATALKGQTKKQGDWGETILESILEKSGLVKNREYFLQETFKHDDESNVRPDVTVRLPDDREIIIDSKVSLNAYLRFSEAEMKEQLDLFLQSHLKAIYTHIDQLKSKRYEEREKSLDFVIMFFPIEPAYLLAIQSDPELWSYAYERRILLISPTNLIAVLKIIADLWKREQQSKNAIEIAKQGGRLYEKFVGFLDSIEDLGRFINRSQESYHKALGQLKDGKGNLIDQAEKLKALGVRTAKKIPSRLLPIDPDDDALDLQAGTTETDKEESPNE